MSTLHYVKFGEDGSVLEVKPVGRGRPPKGFTRCEKKEDGSYEPVNKGTKQSGTENKPQHKIEVVNAERPCTFDEIRKTVKSVKTEIENDTLIKLVCDVHDSCPIEFLKNNPTFSRLEAKKNTGEIHIWFMEYIYDQPDYIIKGAIKETEAASSS